MPRPTVSPETRTIAILLMVFLVSLIFRLWLLDKRWINPDEGAHLMDAVLVLDGKVPFRDFGSRQPFYTYVIAAAFSLLGPTLETGRGLMLACSMMTGVFVFLIARNLFDTKVAVLATATYWLLPLEVFNSPVVKTEPMVMLLGSASFFAITRYCRAERLGWLIASGALAALAFYVRQSALIIPAVMAIFIPIQAGLHWRVVAKGYIAFAIGYLCVVSLMMLYFSTEMDFETVLRSGLNPLAFLFHMLGQTVGLEKSGADAGLLVAKSNWNHYHRYVHDSIFMHVFLLAGAGVGIAIAAYSMIVARTNQERRRTGIAYALLLLWVMFMLIAYWYYFAVRGFFVDYSREFLPPLSILFAAGLIHLLPVLKRKWMTEALIIGVVASGVAIFLIQPYYENLFSMGQYATIGIALTAIAFVTNRSMPKRRHRLLLATLAVLFFLVIMSRRPPLNFFLAGFAPSVAMILVIYIIVATSWVDTMRGWVSHYLRFIGLSVLVGSLIVGVSYSSLLLSVRYESAWSPKAVHTAAEYLRENTVCGDKVLSGAVIWELEASRRPYQNISHPLGFLNHISREQLARIEAAFEANPPKIIVLDGYTEKTYFRWVQSLPDLLRTRYDLKATVGPSKYPVSIYLRRELAGDVPSARKGHERVVRSQEMIQCLAEMPQERTIEASRTRI